MTTRSTRSGFTLIELVVTLLILTAIIIVVGLRSGTFGFWKDEGLIRKVVEISTFLHHQSVVDQRFYVLRFKFGNPNVRDSYSVGVFASATGGGDDLDDADEGTSVAPGSGSAAPGSGSSLSGTASRTGGGQLSAQLSQFLSPAMATDGQMSPPTDFPSLAEEQFLPEGTTIMDVHTMRGTQTANDGEAYILYSPRGFSEFSVIHIQLSSGEQITILINPWTGNPEVYRLYRDFEWSYGRGGKS